MHTSRSSIELSVVNARIWTNNPRRPWVDALAVRGGRIASLGSSAEIQKLSADTARIIDAMGSFIIPDFSAPDGKNPFASFDGANHGTLSVGEPANFVMLDRDLTRIPPADIRDARILMTVVSGHVTSQRDEE